MHQSSPFVPYNVEVVWITHGSIIELLQYFYCVVYAPVCMYLLIFSVIIITICPTAGFMLQPR